MRRFLPHPTRCLPWLALVLSLLVTRVAGADELRPVGEGQPFVQYWNPRDFHGSASCVGIVQDANGVMYIGNHGMVLEYDGSTWRQVPMRDSWDVAGMDYDAGTDTVFVGKAEDLGYLKTEPGGAHTYVSLHDQLPAEARNAGSFRGVHATPEGVFFVGSDQVLRWRDGRFKAWKLATETALHSYWVAGRLYVASRSLGLMCLERDEFVAASDDPIFHEVDVYALLPEPDGTLLIASHKHGLFILRDGVATRAENECDRFFAEQGIVRVLRLRDGSLAVGTMRGGLVILDPARRFRSRLDKTGGLLSNYVAALFEDAEGGLWVGQFTGVARVEVDSPLSVYRAGPDEDMASSGASAHWSGTMAVGSNNGVHRLLPADPAAAASPRLELLAGNITAANGLCTVSNGVLAVNTGQLVLLDNERKVVSVLEKMTVVQVIASRAYPGRAYYATQGGHLGKLRLDAATQKWINDGIVADLGVTTGRLLLGESPSGDLWAGTNEHGLFRVQCDPAGAATKVTSFFDQAGPLHGVGLVFPCRGGGPVVFKTSHGLYRFDDASQSIEPLTAFGERLYDGSVGLDEIMSFDARSLWLTYRNSRDPQEDKFRGRIIAGEPGGAPVLQPLPRKIEALVGEIRYFRPVEQAPEALKSLLIVGSTGNGIVRLDVPRWESQGPPRPFATLIRRAFTTQGEGAANERPILQDPLPYARNTMHFEYAAGTLAFGAAPRFQTRLANFGTGGWSEFTDRTSVDYLNLPEGRYTFEVRARNSDGQTGGVASLPFRVLPPWQRSAWAYALYAMVAALGVYALVRWRGRQLRRRNLALETLVEVRTGELRGREADLVRARDEAEGANRAKSAFLANMSHELRTPLNAVLGHSQLLLKQTNLPADSRERVAIIGRSGGHLLSLVNEVLDLSKVEAGKLTLSPFDFSLDGLLGEVAAVFRPRFTEKGLTFTDDRAPGLPATVHTDPSRLRQVLYNLLSNAVKFTARGGVWLTVRPGEKGRVRFEVADTGVGIAPEDQRDIFLAFYQTGERRLASQGTGLGLTISQRLVELLGGRIEVASTPGQGSRFWFELPLAEVDSSGGPSAYGAQDPALGRVTGYEGKTRRLLLVDDVAENRRVLRDFLQPLGFEIEEAADGKSCLASCARAMPDGVLLDLRLGVLHGFEVARVLRARLDGAPLGIIAISASVFESDRQQAIDAGCDDFLPKPFEEAQLLATLGRVLGLRWLRETPAAPELATAAALGNGKETLPASEVDLLLEYSLRGDAVGIRRRLDAWHAEGMSARAGELVRRMEVLVAVYDMEAIHDLLLTVRPHDRN